MPSVAQELLAYVHDPALWLLVSFHPQYRLAAWQNDGAGMPLSARILRWLELPASDVLEPLPERVIDEWREQIQAYKGDSAFVESLLTAMEGFHRFAEQSQFPQRLRRYAEALQAIVKDPSDLSADAQAQLHLWTDVDAIPPYSEPEPLPVPEPVASSSSSWSSSELPFESGVVEQTAKQKLLAAGALFTVQTSLKAEHATVVAVSDILFASLDAEHTYRFTYDFATDQVSHIEREGQAMPYALTLEAFVNWATGK
jgi:hypothetical protein